MTAVRVLKPLVAIYQSARRNVPEDFNLHGNFSFRRHIIEITMSLRVSPSNLMLRFQMQ
jgi:hypothetical protein